MFHYKGHYIYCSAVNQEWILEYNHAVVGRYKSAATAKAMATKHINRLVAKEPLKCAGWNDYIT